MLKINIKTSYVSELLLVLLVSVLMTNCDRVEKVVNEVKALQQIKISYDDYDIEFDQYKRSIHVDKNREFMTGHYYVMYENKVSEEFIVKGGVLDGYHRVYTPEGYLTKELPYKNGYLHGLEKHFNKQGQLVGTVTYRKGKKTGNEFEYSDGGKELIKTETINGITYEHSYVNEKQKMTMYKDKIDGKSYEIMIHYNTLEVMDAAFAVRADKDHLGKDAKLYVLDKQYKIIDSISPVEEPEKMQQVFNQLQQ